MIDDFVKTVSAIVPLYPLEATTEQRVPYATYSVNEIPVRTKDGIVGGEGTISLSIYAVSIAAADTLASKVIQAIDRRSFAGRKMYVADMEVNSYPDVGIYSKDVTINFI